ncbi:MAG: hypothetical protein Q8P30_02980 [Candidatus Uhrbacteria bacterium]|nr:hypothetical protein [Candidatus Uhrbacteria bacterium]
MKVAQLLLQYLEDVHQLGTDEEEIPSEFMLLDWEAAGDLDVPDDFDRTVKSYYKLVLKCGFASDIVLQTIDPAIRHIIQRMLALGILVKSACSGHVGEDEEESQSPIIVMIFPDARFGIDFLSVIEDEFSEWKQSGEAILQIRDSVYLECIGSMGPRLPWNLCVQHHLPIELEPETLDPYRIQEFWSLVACTLNLFDRLGELSEPIQLDYGDEDPVCAHEFRNILEFVRRRWIHNNGLLITPTDQSDDFEN